MDEKRVPLYASRTTLAQLLDCSPATVDSYSKSGYLPRPEIIGNMPRWDVSLVVAHIKAMNASGVVIEEDDFLKALGDGKAAQG